MVLLKAQQRKAKPKAKEQKVHKSKLSKYIKKTAKGGQSKRDNTYVFEGFYERLKNVDVKHANSLESAFTYDKLLEQSDLLDDDEEAQLFKSNFIQLLRSEKANNKTVEFAKVYTDVERFCYSYPLLVHNKTKIIERLLHYLEQPDTVKIVQTGVIDLFIALIKDFRTDIYQDFLALILPRIIQSLDMSNVQLLDKIFTLLSFAVKYLTRSIKEDLQNFYGIYSELLAHKNKFVRKFSAQAFCYVVRKLPLQGALMQTILKPLMDTSDRVLDHVLGVSELLFEVAYGASEGLHSKAKEVMVQVLCFERSEKARLVIRCMFQKLVNEVDTEKHQQIYDTLNQTLDWKEDQNDLEILLDVYRDTIKLKFGRRVPHYGIASITECLNHLLSSAQILKTKAFPVDLKVALAETMAVFYYFKHNMILGLFQKSQMDISSSKNLFNHFIYTLPTNEDTLKVITAYFNLFIHSPSQVADVVYNKKAGEVDWTKLLGLRQTQNNQMEYTLESHRNKLKLLIKSYNQYLLKKVQDSKISNSTKVELIAIFERLAAQLGDQIVIDLASKYKEELEKAIYALFASGQSSMEQYVLFRFLSRCRVTQTGFLFQSIKKHAHEKVMTANGSVFRKELDEAIVSNMVIKNYNITPQDVEELKSTTMELLELQNIGRVENIPAQIAALRATFLQRNSKVTGKDILGLIAGHPDDIVVLRAFNSLPNEQPYIISEHRDIFKKLSMNLLKNQRDVRLQTLRAMCQKFERLDSKLSSEELPLKCDILDNLLACEEQELTIKTEKAKLLQIDRVKAQLENDSVPQEYLLPVFNFLVGTFWIRFTPLFDRIQQTLRVLVREHSDEFAPRLFALLKNVNYLAQLAHSNIDLTNTLIEPVEQESSSMVLTAYLSETKLEEDFMDVKDFFYNLAKSLCMQTVFQDKKLRSRFFSELFYPFIENEYTVLNFVQNAKKGGDILDRMTLSNMVDSEAFKFFRRQAYTKMYAFVELLVQAESLTKVPRVADLQKLMLRMLNTSDTKLQKLVLDVLLKTDAQGVLRTYRKMLDGFTDDIKFKDMIQVMNFGSNVSGSTGTQALGVGDNEEQGKQEKNLPKVAKEHRLQVLPVVVKLLLSKLIKKKGQIKQKTVHQRRHIVYQFMSSLAEDDEEMQVFMDEMLFSIGIQIAEVIPTQQELRERLTAASFSGYLNFIGSVEVIIKQMGSHLVTNGYLDRLTTIFTEILYLTKVFTKHLKLSLAEQKSVFDEPLVKEEAKEESENSDIDSDVDMPESNEPVSNKDALYRFVGHQSKMCLKKGLALIKQLYSKYSNLPVFLNSFTAQLNTAIIQELLPTFTTNYITDRSQLIEVLTLSWSQYNPSSYIAYPEVMKTLLSMLCEAKIQPEVYETLLQMLKNIILKCSEDGNLGVRFLVKKQNDNIDDGDQEMVEPESTKEERAQAQLVMSTFVVQIADSLQHFCGHHLNELKNTLILKTSMNKKQQKNIPRKHNAHEIKNQTIKDLIFVMSEIAKHMPSGDSHNQNFLEMIISVLSMKNLHQSDYATSYYEELLQFGVASLPSIIDKLPHEALSQPALSDKLFQLFLLLRNLRIRSILAVSLQNCKMNTVVKPDVLQIITDLNRLKRGAADLELDYDCAIKTIEKTIEGQAQLESTLTLVELQGITYSILHLMQSEEFSVRDFACHYVKQVLLDRCFKSNPSIPLLTIVESTLLRHVGRVGDEMVLKSILDVLRHYISFLKSQSEELAALGFKPYLTCLAPLVNLKDDNDDFFTSFLAIKMKNRQKALRMLSTRLEAIGNYKAIQAIVMPMVNYIIFGDKSQKSNRRNTITYSREEKRGTLEEAMNVYQSLAQTLNWPDYFRLLKTLLFKLNRVIARQSLAKTDNSVDEELISQEKVVVKCICRVLNGFHFDGIQDALTVYLEKGDTMLPQVTEDTLGQELEDVFKQVAQNEIEDQDIDIESEQELPIEVDEAEQAHITDIQQKIYQKVLPILERHMSDIPKSLEKKGKDDKPDTPTIRSYVVVSIMKAIRKLPVGIFQNQFRKLVSTIVSKGLRQRDIACRDKGRKALLKLAEELSPRPQILLVIFSELKEQLKLAGYQLHTFVFTVHFLLQQLHERKLLRPSDISTPIIELLGEKFLEELFLSNSGIDGALEDMEKIKIKESKSKKAIPVFEMFAQYMDFKQSFFSLIGPIVKTLEENPTITKIQMCEELLNRLSNSLMRNESVKRDELLMFMYTIIQRGVGMAVKVQINGDKGVERDYGAKARDIFLKTKQEYKEMTYSVEMKWRKTGQQLDDKKTQEICGRVLGSFGLQCMKRALKSTSIILKPVKEETTPQEEVSEDLRAQLDPFVPLLLDAFRTYHNPIIVTTLHVLGQMIPLNLPTFKELMKKFLNKIFKLFETTSSSSDLDFLNSLFRCTSELIRTYATYSDLSQPQVKTLVNIVRQHIGTASTQGNVFQCLKAIVYRKFVSADLYDLMEQVQELMITNIAKSTRSVCASIFTQFLLEYPLEQSRVEQHVNHLLKNLGYFDSEGRLQVLDVLNSLIERFPKELLDHYAELIFFTLVLRTVNESNPKVRERVLQVTKRLTGKCSPAKAKTLFKTVLLMQTHDQEDTSKRFQLSQAKQLILGVFIESQKQALQQIFEQCLSLLQEEAIKLVEDNQRYLDAKQDEESEEEDGYDDAVKNTEMKGFLKSIDLLEEGAEPVKTKQQHLINFEEEKHMARWSPLYYGLLNLETIFATEEAPSQQVVNLVSNKQNMQNLLPNLLLVGLHHKTYWIRLGVQRVYGALFSLQMKTDIAIIQEDAGEVLYKLASTFKFKPMLTEELGTQLVKNLTFLLKTVIAEGAESLPKLFSRLSFVARKLMLNVNEAKDRIAHVLLYFQVALHLFSQQHEDAMDNALSRSVLTPILELVYRVYTDEQYGESRAKELAFELVDSLSAGMDKAFFIQTYNAVKQGIVQKRMERKKQQKIVMAGAEGAKIKEQRRNRKVEKKRQQKRDKKLQLELRKK